MNILDSFSGNQLRTEYLSLNCDSYMNMTTPATRERMGVEPDQISRIIIAAMLDNLRRKRWNLINGREKEERELLYQQNAQNNHKH